MTAHATPNSRPNLNPTRSSATIWRSGNNCAPSLTAGAFVIPDPDHLSSALTCGNTASPPALALPPDLSRVWTP